MSNIRLSVIIPAYNEEKRLPKTLIEIDKYLSKQDYNYEIVVVDDGSRDETVAITKEMVSKIRNLRVIDNKENHGKGYVVKQGMLQSNGEYRLFMDADNSTSVDQVEGMWPYFEEKFDIIIGSREIEGAVLDPPQPITRKPKGAAFRLLTNVFAWLWDIKDTQCGFKAFTREAAENIFKECKIDRFAFDVEALVIARKLNYKIKEMPITWVNDLESKVKFKNMAKMGFDLVKIRWNLIKGVYGQK